MPSLAPHYELFATINDFGQFQDSLYIFVLKARKGASDASGSGVLLHVAQAHSALGKD